jgi:hypothetical protein
VDATPRRECPATVSRRTEREIVAFRIDDQHACPARAHLFKCFEQFAAHRKVDSVANRVIERDRGDLAFKIGTY